DNALHRTAKLKDDGFQQVMGERASDGHTLKLNADCLRLKCADPERQVPIGINVFKHHHTVLRHQTYADAVDLYPDHVYPRHPRTGGTPNDCMQGPTRGWSPRLRGHSKRLYHRVDRETQARVSVKGILAGRWNRGRREAHLCGIRLICSHHTSRAIRVS